jgi:RNA recognition motif-containing protein
MIAYKLAVVTEYLKEIHTPMGFRPDLKSSYPLYFKWFGEDRIVTIYVGNLSFQASEDDLREVFAEYGEVSRVSLPTDRETGRKRGFAFVEMSSEAQEDAAITELDGAEWLGREIRVNKAKPREEGGGGGGGNRRNGGFSRD